MLALSSIVDPHIVVKHPNIWSADLVALIAPGRYFTTHCFIVHNGLEIVESDLLAFVAL